MSERVENSIEKALRSEPRLNLGDGFADKVVRKIRKRESANQRKLYIWMILGVLAMFGFGYVIIKVFMPETITGQSFNLGDQFNKVIPFSVLVGILVVAIQFLDQKLVKEKYLFD